VSSNGFAGNPSPAQQYLRITELMYNPSPAPAINSDAQQFEYVELKNISTSVTTEPHGGELFQRHHLWFHGQAVTSLLPQQTVLIRCQSGGIHRPLRIGFHHRRSIYRALNNGGETVRLDDAVGEKIWNLPTTTNGTRSPTASASRWSSSMKRPLGHLG